jgi:signal transduction histidine kinase
MALKKVIPVENAVASTRRGDVLVVAGGGNGGPAQEKPWAAPAVLLLTAAIFGTDLLLPLGVAGGVPYVAVILFGWWLERPGSVIWLAALCSILTVLGYLLSPEGGVPWVVLLNRALALFAIWVTVVLVDHAKGAETRIRAARDEAEALAAARSTELRESEKRLRDAVEALPVGFAIYDKDDRLTLCNELYRDHAFHHVDSVPLGATFGEILRHKLECGHYPEAEGRQDDWLAERLRLHRDPPGPFEQRHSNGRWYWINERRTEEGGIVAISSDITERKRLQGEVLRQERLATLGRLTATVSHELRNPLGVIRTSAFIANEGQSDANPRVQRALERIDRSVVRCDRIIDELLDFTRISDLEPEPTALDSWLDSTLSEQVLPSEVELRREFNMAGIEIAIDRDRIRRAVINVFDNACQAMTDPAARNDGDARHILTVTTQAVEDRIEIVFEDNGPGIPADIRPMIFEPLFSTKGFGVGLGLPAVKQIMEQHGGGIDIDSVPGQGARVRLWLPRRSSAPTAG